MPVDYKKYAANWKEIRARILDRAGHCCEGCGVKNHAVGARDLRNQWHDEDSVHGMNSDYGYALFGGEFPAMIKIVLTIAHVDHDVTNNADDNLRAWCQQCHNRHDAKMRAGHAAITRRKKRESATGQIAMFKDGE